MRPDGRSVLLGRSFGSSAVNSVAYSGGNRGIARTAGRIDAVSEGDNQLNLSWNEEVLGAQIWFGPELNGRVDYTYGSGRRIQSLSVVGGAAVTYGYDNDSLVTSASVAGATLTLSRHAANGLLTGTQIGGLGDTWTHNDFAEPLSYRATYNGAPMMESTYTRDRLGRIATRSENAGGAGFAEAYGYELSGRLDTVHRGGALVSDYGFDSNGNRTSHRIGAASPLRGRAWPCLGDLAGTAEVTVAGSFDAQDRMQSYGTCQYEYTRNGELTRRTDSASGAVTNYQYDEFGNLRRVDLADARVVTYHIDGLNRRVGKSIDGVRQWGLLYANQLEPVAELDGAGNIVASFLYADRPHVPSLMLKGGHTYRILSDHLGSVRLVIDLADGSIAQRLAYDEYGNIVEDTNPGFQPFAYAGGLYDRDTGLTRFGARDYDPLSGRWTAKDPIGFRGRDTNMYRYAAGDSINLIDPSGLAPGDRFDTHQAAAVDALRHIWEKYPDSPIREYCGWIRQDGDCFTYEEPKPGTPPDDVGDGARGECRVGRPDSDDVAWYHNHIKDPAFSGPDKVVTDHFEKTGYSGVKDASGTESFHHFEPGWDVDAASSQPFIPVPD
ncbi:MAG: RHS repeat-associated core domain-containing protein [Xanthomonadales bacterium]|nr:RHS repeat-associated core domain-containing protein [Xanthomonadales bacterium]